MRLGVLGSGKGSNFAAILRAIQNGELSASVEIVISDNPGAGILEIAREANIPTYSLVEPAYRTRLSPSTEEELVSVLKAAQVDLVVLAGYMRVVKKPMLDAFSDRIVNIHPSLLPLFRGLAAWKQALTAGVAETGCTVHYVNEEVDAGEILGQEKVPVLPGDTAESLHARIQEAEHRLYPEILRRLAEQRA